MGRHQRRAHLHQSSRDRMGGAGLGCATVTRVALCILSCAAAAAAGSATGAPGFGVAVYDSPLSVGEENSLRSQLRALQTAYAAAVSPERRAKVFSNRWIDRAMLDGAEPPLCDLEAVVSRLWQRVVAPGLETRGSVAGASPDEIVGAEWWLQWRSEREGMHWHVDRDEAAREAARSGKRGVPKNRPGRYDEHGWAHPVLSTVWYAGETGGCTAVLHQAMLPHWARAKFDPELPAEATLSCPQLGRYLVFDGAYPHAVVPSASSVREGFTSWDDMLRSAAPRLEPTRKDVDKHRLTLLVNFWDVKLAESDGSRAQRSTADALKLQPLPARLLQKLQMSDSPLPMADDGRLDTAQPVTPRRITVASPWEGAEGPDVAVAAAAAAPQNYLEMVALSHTPPPAFVLPMPASQDRDVVSVVFGPGAVQRGGDVRFAAHGAAAHGDTSAAAATTEL